MAKNSWKKSKKLFESVIIVTAPRKLIFKEPPGLNLIQTG